MFRATVRATVDSDVDAAVADLRAQCDQGKISAISTTMITHEVRAILDTLIARGKELASLGSNMQVSREIRGEGFAVQIFFNEKEQQNIFKRILNLFR